MSRGTLASWGGGPGRERYAGGRFAFDRWDGQTPLVNSLAFLAAVNVVVWAGLFLYLWRLDRRISEGERKR
jgi:CcmD family protein